jgi:hypothetical protein
MIDDVETLRKLIENCKSLELAFLAPDLAAEVLRLTAERDAALAANRQLVARDAQARVIMEYWASWDHRWPGNINLEAGADAARAFLAEEAKP